MARQFSARKTFTVDGVSGHYPTEEIIFAAPSTSVAAPSIVGLSLLLETLGAATGATVEIWLLKQGGDPTDTAQWFLYKAGALAAVGGDTWPLAGVEGVKVKIKSASAAGSPVVSAWAD